MKEFRYLEGVATLALDKEKCIGCSMCVTVCPHRIFTVQERKAQIMDFDACMECGACAVNCPAEAIAVTPGVGCASYLMSVWLHKLTGKKVESVCC